MSAEELVDIVDKDDVVIDCVPRRAMRQHNLRHRCVYVLVFSSNGKLLIHQRTASKDVYPGYWDVAFGGVLAAGEQYEQAAQRELLEECGVSSPLTKLFRVDYEDASTRILGMAYRTTSDGPFRLQEAEVQTTEWIAPNKVRNLSASRRFCPDGIVVLRRYLSQPTATGTAGG